MAKKKNRKVPKGPKLPHGAITELARRQREAGRRPCSESGVWRAIYESQNEEMINLALAYAKEVKEKKAAKATRLQRLADAFAS